MNLEGEEVIQPHVSNLQGAVHFSLENAQNTASGFMGNEIVNLILNLHVNNSQLTSYHTQSAVGTGRPQKISTQFED